MTDEELEATLRSRLHSEIDPRVPGPAAEQRVLAAVSDAGAAGAGRFAFRIGPRTGAAIAAAMVVLVVGGALGVSLALRGARTVGPAPATSVPPLTSSRHRRHRHCRPRPHRPCRRSRRRWLQVCSPAPPQCSARGSTTRTGSPGSSGGDIALRNDGTVACTLEGYVNLRGVVDGRVVQLGVTRSVDAPMLNNNNGTLPTVRLITIRPGQSAYFAYEVSDVINGPTPCSSTQTLLITPPHDGASVTLTDTPLSLCGGFQTTLWIDIAPVSSVPFYNTSIP